MTNAPNPKMFHLLHRVHQSLFRASDRMLGEQFGISTTQSAVMLYLKRRDGVSMGELASAIGLKITSASGLVDRMENKGLLSRIRSKADRRAMEVTLTPEGRALLTQAEPIVAQSNRQLIEKIATVVDVEKFALACETIISASEDMYANTAAVTKDTTNKKINQTL